MRNVSPIIAFLIHWYTKVRISNYQQLFTVTGGEGGDPKGLSRPKSEGLVLSSKTDIECQARTSFLYNAHLHFTHPDIIS